MASLNKVTLIGNLGRDPEMFYTPTGERLAVISVATEESWKDKITGQKKFVTEWHRVVFFKKLADLAADYLKKGTRVYIEGRLCTRKWVDKSGLDKHGTEIIGNDLLMLDYRKTDIQPIEQDKATSTDEEQINDILPFNLHVSKEVDKVPC